MPRTSRIRGGEKRANLPAIMLSQRGFGSAAARGLHIVARGLIVVLTCGLYLAFIDNPLVFDDWVFFAGTNFAYYATHPVGLGARLPGYFSLAFTEVLWSRIEAHRGVSLALHLACALILYELLCALLRAPREGGAAQWTVEDERRTAACALFGAAAFAIHPVAVYGAGYLMQRSIVVATLFALLSLILLRYGLMRDRYAGTVAAAVCYTLAALSKEHSVLLPAAALPMVLLPNVCAQARNRHVVLYLTACLPAALWVMFLGKHLVGQAYEPHIDAVVAQVDSGSDIGGAVLSWPLSVLNQMGLFFKYLGAWLWPQTQAMSIDLRVAPFVAGSLSWLTLNLGLFTAFGALGFVLLLRKHRMGLIGFGMLYTWILFLVELSVLRFQEPFVLYRSYLWAPGIALAVGAVLGAFNHRVALAAAALCCPFLLYQAHDRLTTFSSSLLLWEDAAAKLPQVPVLWGSRVLYNLGREYLRSAQPGKAVAVIDRCMEDYPDTHHCVFARGAIHFQTGEYQQALTRFKRAAEIEPKSGVTQHRIGIALERLNLIDEAKLHYRAAAALGYRGGDMELSRFGESAGEAPPQTDSPRATP